MVLAAGIAFVCGWSANGSRRRRAVAECELHVRANHKLHEWAETEKRRATELEESIGGVLKERDNWRDLYWRSSAEAGNAQQMLMLERSRLVRQIVASGKKPAVDPAIEAVVAEFEDNHAQAGRQNLGLAAYVSPGPKDGVHGTSPEGGTA